MFASAAKTGRVIVAHEAVRNFGAGAEIAASINEEPFGKLKKAVIRLGAPTSPVPFSKPLEDAFLVSPEQVVAACNALMG